LDRRERLQPEHPRPLVRAHHDPALALEPIDLDRTGKRVDEPEVRDLLASVRAELPPAIEVRRRGRDHLAHPAGAQREPGEVGGRSRKGPYHAARSRISRAAPSPFRGETSRRRRITRVSCRGNAWERNTRRPLELTAPNALSYKEGP